MITIVKWNLKKYRMWMQAQLKCLRISPGTGYHEYKEGPS